MTETTGDAIATERIAKYVPTLFNTPMVEAILADRKTHTRRVLKPRRLLDFYSAHTWNIKPHPGGGYWAAQGEFPPEPSDPHGFMLPYGPGDILWVRETWARSMATAYRQSPGVVFTPNPDDPHSGAVYKAGWERVKPGPWKPSIHMPRWAARIFLRVMRVWLEPLKKISQVDCINEGVLTLEKEWVYAHFPKYKAELDEWELAYPYHRPPLGPSPYDRFAALWDSINAKRGYPWESNPWVICTEFERIKNYDNC